MHYIEAYHIYNFPGIMFVEFFGKEYLQAMDKYYYPPVLCAGGVPDGKSNINESAPNVLFMHCKKLEVDLTQKRPSQLQSGFVQVQAVAHLLLPGFRVTPFVQWRFLVNNELGCK